MSSGGLGIYFDAGGAGCGQAVGLSAKVIFMWSQREIKPLFAPSPRPAPLQTEAFTLRRWTPARRQPSKPSLNKPDLWGSLFPLQTDQENLPSRTLLDFWFLYLQRSFGIFAAEISQIFLQMGAWFDNTHACWQRPSSQIYVKWICFRAEKYWDLRTLSKNQLCPLIFIFL